MRAFLLALLFLAASCGGTTTSDDAGVDSGTADAAIDSGAPDARTDGGCTTDADGDGHVSIACGGDDCDDTDAHRFPTNPEVCDAAGHDEDCVDSTLGPDLDSDTYVSTTCCFLPSSGPIVCGNDCDDTRLNVNPSATEVCNGVDDDCNGMLDGPAEDDDHDGHANDACAGAGGTDCDDADAATYDGAPEVCDGQQNDCSASWTASSEVDMDHDGHLAPGALASCTLPADDCDDTDAARNPGTPEICRNGVDENCNGAIDEAGCFDPEAGHIECVTTSCDSPAEDCCLQAPSTSVCQARSTGCAGFGVALECDGPEDCAPGQVCCYGVGPASCATSCPGPYRSLCHRDLDCPSGTSCMAASILSFTEHECF